MFEVTTLNWLSRIEPRVDDSISNIDCPKFPTQIMCNTPSWSCFSSLQRWEGQNRLVLPNVVQPNETRIKVALGVVAIYGDYSEQENSIRRPIRFPPSWVSQRFGLVKIEVPLRAATITNQGWSRTMECRLRHASLYENNFVVGCLLRPTRIFTIHKRRVVNGD